MIHRVPEIKDRRTGHVFRALQLREVRVLAIADGYALIRCPGCFPYACPIKELEGPTP